MKRLIVIVLFLLVFINHGAYHVISLIQRMAIKKEVKRQLLQSIPDYSLDKVELNSNIKWEEDGREFYFNGEFYDIVSTELKDGKTIFHCLKDDKETEWLKSIASRLNRATDDKCKKLKTAIFSFECTAVFEDISSPRSSSSPNFIVQQSQLVYTDDQVDSPPPRI